MASKYPCLEDFIRLRCLQSGLGAYQTSADDAYNFYASKNPFESNGYGEDLLGDVGSRPAGKNVRFDTGTPRSGATLGLLGGPDDRSDARKAQQKEYASILQQQMEEVRERREMTSLSFPYRTSSGRGLVVGKSR